MQVLLLIITFGVGIILHETESAEDIHRWKQNSPSFPTSKYRYRRSNADEIEPEDPTEDYEFQSDPEVEVTESVQVKVGDPICGPSPTLEHATIDDIQDEYPVGSEITYECDAGYVQQGKRRTIECVLRNRGKQAQWTQLRITCVEESKCGPPPHLENGKVDEALEKYPVGSTVTYKCDFGYVTQGRGRTVRCEQKRKNVKWTRIQISCVPRSCADPGYVQNARRIGSVFTFPNEVTFHCEDGFKIKGSATRYCLASGTWSGNLPTCEKVSCDPPGELENGKAIYWSLEYGSELTYECNKGFIIQNFQPRFCSATGIWNGEEPKCIESDCEPPTAPPHGAFDLVGGRAKVDSIVVYSCFDDRVIVGSATSKCLSTGQWTFPTPKCSKPCAVPYITAGRLGKYATRLVKKNRDYVTERYFEPTRVGATIDPGRDLIFQCANGYAIRGKDEAEDRVVCDDGQWSRDFQCISMSCTEEPPATENAYIHKINKDHGGTVTYYCNDGFSKAKYGNVTCQYGEWVGVTPICEDTRCYKDQLDYPGLVKGGINIYNDRTNFAPVCETGFKLTQPGYRFTCRRGKWEGPIPPCTGASCSKDPPALLNGYATGFARNPDSVVKYTCHEHYLLRGNSTIKCWLGEWTGSLPRCVDTRCYVKNLQGKKGVTTRTDSVTLSGSRLNVKCEQGYSRGDIAPFCFNGEWEEKSPACIRADEGMEPEEEKHITPEFPVNSPTTESDVAVEELTVDFPGTDEESIPGEDAEDLLPNPQGVDSADEVTEAPQCFCTYINHDNTIIAFADGQMLKYGNKVKLRHKVEFHCEEFGFARLSGESEITCVDCETWSISTLPTCEQPRYSDTSIVINKNLITIQSGGVVAIHEGSSVSFPCYGAADFKLPQWFYIGPKFPRDIRLKNYGVPNYRVACMEINRAAPHHEGTYGCHIPGYRKTYLTLKILGDAKRCEEFDEDTHIIHYDNDRKINSSAMFYCKKLGEKIVGSSVLNCLPNGTWSDSPPKCRGNTCPVIDAIEGMQISYSNGFHVGSKATFSCLAHRQLVGVSQIRCLGNATWSGPAPLCERIFCPEIPQIDGMEISFSKHFDVESTATFHCFPPRVLTGLSQVRCTRDGTWSGSIPSCQLENCSMESLFDILRENVAPTMESVTGETMPYNSTLLLTCDQDLMLVGDPVAKCGSRGRWKVGDVQCVSACAPFQKPPSSELIIEPEKSFFMFGEFVFFSCPDGLSLTPDVQRVICLGDRWSERKVPDCETETSTPLGIDI